MSIFKNTLTGDITTVFGPIHDAFLTRANEEIVLDDRDAELPQLGGDIAPDPAPVTDEPVTPTSSGNAPKDNQETPDAAGADNLEEQ